MSRNAHIYRDEVTNGWILEIRDFSGEWFFHSAHGSKAAARAELARLVP